MPITAWSVDDDRGRHELRTIQALPAPADLNFPCTAQVFLIERTVTVKGRSRCRSMSSMVTVYKIGNGPDLI